MIWCFQMVRHNLPRGNKYHECHRVCGTKNYGNLNAVISWRSRLGDLMNAPVQPNTPWQRIIIIYMRFGRVVRIFLKLLWKKNLCVYTNSDLDVNEYLLKHRRALWRYVIKLKTKFNKQGITEPGPDNYVS